MGITEILTYADNYAVAFFRKQGFTERISMTEARYK
ncbi:hypothetical protein KIPB_014833, partial [Kipferlia bialata]|eukprot:g14833.t1